MSSWSGGDQIASTSALPPLPPPSVPLNGSQSHTAYLLAHSKKPLGDTAVYWTALPADAEVGLMDHKERKKDGNPGNAIMGGLPERELGFWERSRLRAKRDRGSWDYVLRSGIAGGVAGCVAKTAIAPLDRVKILFQTSQADFRKFAGTPLGLLHATKVIYNAQGVRGLYQGHSATLLRIFPYAGIKFMAYEKMEGLIMPQKEQRTPGRLFLAGSLSGVTSVFITYPLELVRVRLAYQTKQSERHNLRSTIRSIYADGLSPSPSSRSSTSALPRPATTLLQTIQPFYRGFSITLLGMVPYAGVSFLTYGTLKRHLPTWVPALANQKTVSDLACGAVAGMVSQTASYPFEVVRRRMQVGGIKAAAGSGGVRGSEVGWRDAVRGVWTEGKGKWGRGFFVGLSIGYLKVIPMTSLSFATWQLMKRLMDI